MVAVVGASLYDVRTQVSIDVRKTRFVCIIGLGVGGMYTASGEHIGRCRVDGVGADFGVDFG